MSLQDKDNVYLLQIGGLHPFQPALGAQVHRALEVIPQLGEIPSQTRGLASPDSYS